MAKFQKGHAKAGGRKAGTPNKVAADIKALAGKHGEEVIAGFIEMFRKSDNESVRIAAGKELLDRGYGKASQPIGGAEDLPAIRTVLEVAFVGVRSNGQG